jgi:hypothetical protein
MYSFNGKDYVVLELNDETAVNKQNGLTKTELSANIEGRYVEGDNILGHKIIDINTRTKSVELYKKLDEEYGYTIYLSNYGISVSDLKKIEQKEEPKKEDKNSVKKAFEQVKTEQKNVSEKNFSCYIVNKQNLNVRNSTNSDARILRILKLDDKFTIKEKNNDWLQIDTIYKKVSGDVMNVSNENNWVQLVEGNVSLSDNCK